MFKFSDVSRPRTAENLSLVTNNNKGTDLPLCLVKDMHFPRTGTSVLFYAVSLIVIFVDSVFEVVDSRYTT